MVIKNQTNNPSTPPMARMADIGSGAYSLDETPARILNVTCWVKLKMLAKTVSVATEYLMPFIWTMCLVSLDLNPAIIRLTPGE